MASWREIERIRKHPDEVRGLAARLLLLTDDLSEWEQVFLEGTTRMLAAKEFSNRQSEKLLEIRDGVESITSIRGFNVEALIRKCHEARLDLSEDDERWINAVHERGVASIKRRQAFRLMQCCRQLGLIEQDEPAVLA